MKVKALFIMTVFAINFTSCENNKRRSEVAKIVNELMGKEIQFPDNVPCYASGNETLLEFYADCFEKDYKILLYVNATICKLNLLLFF